MIRLRGGVLCDLCGYFASFALKAVDFLKDTKDFNGPRRQLISRLQNLAGRPRYRSAPLRMLVIGHQHSDFNFRDTKVPAKMGEVKRTDGTGNRD